MRERKRTGRRSVGGPTTLGRRLSTRGAVRTLRAPAALVICAVGLMIGAPFARAKQKPPATKTISGQVLDASSHGIVGASVLLTDMQVHKTDAIYSGANGNYNFSGLNAYHDYQVRARYRGQTSETRKVSSMDPRLLVVVNLTVAPSGSDTGQ